MQSRDVCIGIPTELGSFMYSIVSCTIIEHNPVLGIVGEEIITMLSLTMYVTSNAPYNFRNHERLTFWFKQIFETFGEHNWHQQWSLQRLTGAPTSTSTLPRFSGANGHAGQRAWPCEPRAHLSQLETHNVTGWRLFLFLHPPSKGLILFAFLDRLEG